MIDWRTSTFKERIVWARNNLKPFRTQYCVVYDDVDMEAASVMHPDMHFMSMLMHGNLVPPYWVKLKLKEDAERPNFVDHRHLGNFELLNGITPIGSLTEEEAVEYLIKTDIPRRIWENWDKGNRRKLVICNKTQSVSYTHLTLPTTPYV